MPVTGFKLFLYRLIVIVIFPVMIVWTVADRLWIEVRTIPRFVWNDLCEEWGSARQVWNGKRPRRED